MALRAEDLAVDVGDVHAATADVVIVRSPIRGADGRLRVARQPVPAGRLVAESLPKGQDWERVIWNGGVLTPAEHAQVYLQPGDELWLWPAWGLVGGTLGVLLIGAVVSIALTYATYALFPPAKPHINAPEDPTHSFEGIRTAIGPGNSVPIVYGRHRLGGQLISAAVDQVLTITDDGLIPSRIDLSTAPASITMLLAMGEGPVQNINIDSIQINGQPVANFPATKRLTVLGTPDQPALPEFAEQRNSFADGREIPYAPALENQIVYTTTIPVQAFVLNIVFNEGLYNMTAKGEKEINTVSLYYRYRTHTGGALGNFTDWAQYTVTADRTAPVRFGIRHEHLTMSGYDIAVCYANPRHQDDLRGKWKPTLESVSEVQQNTLTYPNTALLGLSSVATDALQGGLPNVTVDVYGRTVRIGTFEPILTWTDNPAWCVLDFLTSTRYGLGIPDSEIDLAAFNVWAAYCDEIFEGEQRHRMNLVISQDSRAQALVMDLMGGSRALLIKSGGRWTPRVTRNEAPVGLISWSNCANLKLTYTRDADRVNVMEARFANEDNEFQQDVLTWPPADQWSAEVHKQSLEIRGVTKPSRIIRALQFELNRRKFENLTLEMDCSVEAVALQVHDVFRFAHPLPGWGVSGRVMAGSTPGVIHLDEDVTMQPGVTYHLYLRFPDDGTDARVVSNPGNALPTRTLTIAGEPFQQHPYARTTLWAFGAATPESAVKLFRVTRMQRKSDTTVHIEAVVHNPSIYDEPEGTPLPVITTLFNPLGPPPPLTFLLLTEVTRVQPSGASLRVVNLSWDVAPLGTGLAPYGGAQLFRRTVLSSGQAGTAEAGVVDLGAIHDLNDPHVDFVPLAQVRGHVLDFDDPTVLTGTTYAYRVVPISGRGVPNEAGGLTQLIHVAGPTTPDFFPGTVQNLRLQGQAVGVHTFEGRDIHVAWDAVSDSPLFSETFFVQDYVVQAWAPGQEYLMRSVVVPTSARGVEVSWTYTYEQNSEDQIRTGMAGPRREVALYVYARTNTGRMSLDPATITVSNPPPDMSMLAPEAKGLFEAALIEWSQFVEPRDFDHYTVYLDTISPPRAIYQDVSMAFQKIFPADLLADATYYVSILPYDSFGAGLSSQITAFVPVALTADKLDTTPPGMPTGLVLSTGTRVSNDGTIVPWVQADWAMNPEGDVAAYDVRFRLGDTTVPSVMTVSAPDHTLRLEALPGNVTVYCRLAAYDQFYNLSPFTPELSITTGRDTVPPVAPSNLVAVGSIRAIQLLWSPPPEKDYAYAQVWANFTPNILDGGAVIVGTGLHSFTHDGLGPTDTRYYWLRSVDTSGNVSPTLYPDVTAPGIAGTAGQLDTTYISSLAADKIITGTLQALVSISVDNTLFLDGTYGRILIYDRQSPPTLRGIFGRLSDVDPTLYGLNIWNGAGQIMWHFGAGATQQGIQDHAINADKIQAATINATHIRTDTAVITTAAQIANALIGFAHIQNAAITNAKIADAAITTAKIADAQITATKIALANIYRAHIIDGEITSAKIGTAQIQTAHIVDLAVDTLKIGTQAVATGKIQDNAVTVGLQVTSGLSVSISFGGLVPGDQIWLMGTATAYDGGSGVINLDLVEDTIGGALRDTAQASHPPGFTSPLAVQAVFTVTAPLSVKVFWLQLGAVSGTTRFVGLLRRK